MDIRFKKVRLPMYSLICVITFIILLSLACRKIYYIQKIPIQLLYVDKDKVAYSISQNTVSNVINQNYCELHVASSNKKIPVFYLDHKFVNIDSLQLFFRLSPKENKERFIYTTHKQDSLVITNTLYNYLYENIVGHR